ncbi:LLM class F420-dependent oxidoreductase [Mycobacterium triplex]|uniref:LLM class F420-dependent oxidoreductase n=1 Tax=Mycobacterium triplex TaxID=47839 RepID=A0A024K4I5_9MYCO|nr:TIGR03857 family LLM class F420-dependent oxidoreductase [Mycobacterium triplex]ORW99785.1 LLM class F420-dependent oxidoreductase [Mycobacterium triplex]CDO90413.1 luciferase family protein [Mycobacterium triplex]
MADNPPVIEDLSAFLISGRVVSRRPADPSDETGARTPVDGIEDGVSADRLGFRRVFISERWNLKEVAVLLAAVAARTSRVELATGLVSPARRNVLHMAAFGATMHACFGPRFVLGLGRGDHSYLRSEGLRTQGFEGLCDYVDIVRRLWAGEAVTYEGPAGRYDGIKLGDVYEGEQPKVWYGTFALPKAANAIARSFDGVLLPPVLTPAATAAAVTRIRQACERIDRDPATVRICQCVITAPGLSDDETRALAHARAVTYLQAPEYGDALVRANDWDTAPVAKLRAHTQFQGNKEMADLTYHRIQLMEPARLIPDAWMEETCALGSVDHCVTQLQRFRDAGADEIATYGSTPGQNAGLIEAWRTRDRIGLRR